MNAEKYKSIRRTDMNLWICPLCEEATGLAEKKDHMLSKHKEWMDESNYAGKDILPQPLSPEVGEALKRLRSLHDKRRGVAA